MRSTSAWPPPRSSLILITGIYQTIDGDWEFGSFWISATFLIVIVLGGLLGAYFIPTDRKLGARDGRDQGRRRRAVHALGRLSGQARREGIFGTVAGILVLLAVFLMVTKPGA